jgi:type I restriction enzyme, S subunit
VEIQRVNLLDRSAFDTAGGLWTGKKGPFVTANVIRNTNFTASGRVDYSDVAVLRVDQGQLAGRQLLPGDIIIERSGGGPSQPVGRVVLFDRNDGIFSYSNFTSRLRVIDRSRFDPRFVFYFLLYFHDSGQTDHLQRRTTGIRNLDWRAYRETAGVPLFEVDEQRRIALLLSALQRAIERQEQLIALTAELKKALTHNMFTEGTRGEPLKKTERGLLPRNWSLRRIGQMFDCFDGERVPVKQSDRLRGPYPYYGASGIVDYVNGYRFDGDYLLIAEDGENLESRKLPIAFIASGKFWVNNHAHVLKNRMGNLRFFAYFISQMEIGDYLSGTTRPKLNKAQMMNMLLPFPPEDEQAEIANLLSAADRKAELHARTHKQLESLFRAILDELMTAQTRIRDLDLSCLRRDEHACGGDGVNVRETHRT